MTLAPLLDEWDTDLASNDPLAFPDYGAQVADLAARRRESVRTGRTAHYVLVEGCFDVLGGSMGVVHGEKVVRAFRRATEARLPVVVVTRSGGARMQEGMVSLLQMARTASALTRHGATGLQSVAVLGSPTTGGVFASYGSLCDLRVAEAGATIGFAGPRVVAQTTGVDVGRRSHTAEAAYAAGLVDAVLPATELAAWVDSALGLVSRPLTVRPLPRPEAPAVEGEGAWSQVLAARRVGRPSGIDVASALCSSWTELASADLVTRAGLATVAGRRVVVIAHDRYAADGRPRPAGYRLAQRAVALAGQLGLPLITLIDTPGADPSPEAEAAGVAREIAVTFAALAGLATPSVAVCVGEGGSGGALALAHTDRFLIQQHAVFSVIGPEGAAAILERDAAKAPEVTPRLKLTSGALAELGVVDAVVPDDVAATVAAVVAALAEARPGDRDRRADEVASRSLAVSAALGEGRER